MNDSRYKKFLIGFQLDLCGTMKSNQHPWEQVADHWKSFSDSGKNVHRDFLDTPEFLRILPEVLNLRGLEIGCGEGYNTRLIAGRGAVMMGIDIAPSMITNANNHPSQSELGIEYYQMSAHDLQFQDEQFDFIVSTMALMDIPNLAETLREAYRVLKKGGFFQCSIIHPCFGTPPYRKHQYNDQGEEIAIEIGRYFQEGANPVDWKFEGQQFSTEHYHRTISTWLNSFTTCGFIFEFMSEPSADTVVVEKCPHLKHTQNVPSSMIMRFRK